MSVGGDAVGGAVVSVVDVVCVVEALKPTNMRIS